MLKRRGNFTLCFAASFAQLSQRRAGARVKAPPGDSRSLPASPAARSGCCRPGFAGRAGGPGALIPGISSSLVPRLQPWHFSPSQHLAPLIPWSRGEPGTCCAGTVSNCRSAAGIWRRGRLRGEGKLEPKTSCRPLATIRGGRLVPQNYVWTWTTGSLAADYPVSRDYQPPPCAVHPSSVLQPASSQQDAVSKWRMPFFPAVA